MRAHGIHGVIDAFSMAMRLALNTVERRRVDHGRHRAGAVVGRVQGGNYLRRILRSGAEGTEAGRTLPLYVIAYDDPGAGDGGFAQFHAASRETEAGEPGQ